MEANEIQELQEHAEHGSHEAAMRPVAFTMAVLAVLVAVTFACGIGDPLESVTFPAIVPVADWAKARFVQSATIRHACAKMPSFLHMIHSSTPRA